MDWSIFAILQMFIMAAAICVAMTLRMRSVMKQNSQFREHLDTVVAEAEANKQPKPEEWVKTVTDDLPKDEASSPIIKVVLGHALENVKDIDKDIVEAVLEADLCASKSDLEALQEELATLQDGRAASGDGEDERNTELKNLLKQFTQDSRSMMACIQTLEVENEALIACLQDNNIEPPASVNIVGEDAAQQETPTAEPEPEPEPEISNADVITDAAQADSDSEPVSEATENESEPENETELEPEPEPETTNTAAEETEKVASESVA